ncbi:hypothetical protein ABLN97_02605 [Mycobacterium tuberculosis]
MTIKNDACLALVENHFSPLMIQSPFRGIAGRRGHEQPGIGTTLGGSVIE